MAGKLFKSQDSEHIKKQMKDYQSKHSVFSHQVSASYLMQMIVEQPDVVGFKIEHYYDEKQNHNLLISGVNSSGKIISESSVGDVPPCPHDCKVEFV